MTSTGDRRLSFVTALEGEKEENISGPITTQEEENKIAIRPPLKKRKSEMNEIGNIPEKTEMVRTLRNEQLIIDVEKLNLSLGNILILVDEGIRY